MVDSITDTLFPQLSLERSNAAVSGRAAVPACGSMAVVNLQPLTVGDKTIMLPSLSVDQNCYPQMLSEVVAHI